MYCSGCGHQVGVGDRVCEGCGRELWGSGALRLTSPREPAQQLSDVFPPAKPAPVAGPLSPVAEPVEALRVARLAPALTSLPSLSQLTTRPRTERDSLALHRRNQRVMTLCFAAVGLSVALILVLGQMLRASGPVRVASPAQASVTPLSKPSPTVTPAPTPKPTKAPSVTKALRLPSDAKTCTALVGADEGTSCGLAKAVALTLPVPPTGTFTRTAKSPNTGNSYTFTCTVKDMVVCRTARGSTVYVLM